MTTSGIDEARSPARTQSSKVYRLHLPERSWWDVVRHSFPVGEELSLTCLLFCFHRFLEHAERQHHQHGLGSHVLRVKLEKLWEFVLKVKSCIGYSDFQEAKIMIIVLMLVLIAAVIILRVYKRRAKSKTQNHPPNPSALQMKVCDAILLALILRLLSSVLRTLTASYSTDTVTALAVFGMAVHLLAADYAYANGGRCGWCQSCCAAASTAASSNTSVPPGVLAQCPRTKRYHTPSNNNHHQQQQQQQQRRRRNQRPTFAGGTISLNSSFFSTTLLASRLNSNVSAFVFVSAAVLAFAFYPDWRHALRRVPAVFDGNGNGKGHGNSGTEKLLLRNHASTYELLPLLIFTMAFLPLDPPTPTTTTTHASCLIQIIPTLPFLSSSSSSNGCGERPETLFFLTALILLCLACPTAMWFLQRYRKVVKGPWDIVHPSLMTSSASSSSSSKLVPVKAWRREGYHKEEGKGSTETKSNKDEQEGS